MAKVRMDAETLNDPPPVCVCCGKPAITLRDQQFRHETLLTRREFTLRLPVCDEHKKQGAYSNHIFYTGLKWAVLVGALGVAAVMLNFEAGLYAILAAVGILSVACLISFRYVNDLLKVTTVEQIYITLAGVSPEFAEAATESQEKNASPFRKVTTVTR